jgi:hypothetical protein
MGKVEIYTGFVRNLLGTHIWKERKRDEDYKNVDLSEICCKRNELKQFSILSSDGLCCQQC